MSVMTLKPVRMAVFGVGTGLGLLVTYPIDVMADTISPHVNDDGTVYSTEAPNTSFFGTGISGRMNEASTLRFSGEQDLADLKYDDAIRKLGKAIQLDPGDPEGHMQYARAMTAKILKSLKSKNQTVDSDLIDRCRAEWKMLARHDADMLNQYEAGTNLRRMNKIAKAMKKAEKIAQKQHRDYQDKTSSQVADKPGPTKTQ